jgi:hypothetical protein
MIWLINQLPHLIVSMILKNTAKYLKEKCKVNARNTD